MLSSFFVALMLAYYACCDDPENRHVKRFYDAASSSARNHFGYMLRYICTIIIALKCLSILDW